MFGMIASYHRKLEMSGYGVMQSSPADVVGIDRAKAYYSNYLTEFSDISSAIKDVFGMDDKMVKHGNFKIRDVVKGIH